MKEFLVPYEELPSYLSTAHEQVSILIINHHTTVINIKFLICILIIEKVCSNEKIVLFLDDYNVRSNRSNPSCELVPFSEGFLVTNAFAFQKDSPYIQLFNVQ